MTLPITELKEELLSFLNRQKLSYKAGNVIINFAFRIKEINITSLIDPVLSENNKVFYINRPEEDLCFLAFKEALSLKINGMNQFTALGEKISVVLQNLVSNWDEVSSSKFPLFLGGTKFSAGKHSDEWKDFSDNDWFIPRFILFQRGKDQWLVFNFIMNNEIPRGQQIDCLLEPLVNLPDKEYLLQKEINEIQIPSSEQERLEWNNLISDALYGINDGLFRKVVISRRIIALIKHTPLFNDFLLKLQENYQNCTIFLFKTGKSVLFGATPEQLLKLKGNELEFDALAGSARRGSIENDDKIIADNLLKDKKNTEEHNHVIEFIKDASSPYVNNLRQFDTGIKKFSNIQHIYTPIKAELKTHEQIYNLLNAIFPTPAICGYPKESSSNYINDNEKFDRGLFSGIVGFISPEEMDLVVAIRSALINDNKIYVYAGCGIVKGSDPISEFEETEIKMNPILSLFDNESK